MSPERTDIMRAEKFRAMLTDVAYGGPVGPLAAHDEAQRDRIRVLTEALRRERDHHAGHGRAPIVARIAAVLDADAGSVEPPQPQPTWESGTILYEWHDAESGVVLAMRHVAPYELGAPRPGEGCWVPVQHDPMAWPVKPYTLTLTYADGQKFMYTQPEE